MRYRLRTLLIVLALGPPLLVGGYRECYRLERRLRSALTQIEKLENAIDDYRADVGMPPPDLEALLQPPGELTNTARWKGPYRGLPLPTDRWGNVFEYERISKTRFTVFSKGYRIWTKGSDGVSGTADDEYR